MICGSRASSVGYNEFTRDDGRMEAFKPELGKQKLEEVLNEKAFN